MRAYGADFQIVLTCLTCQDDISDIFRLEYAIGNETLQEYMRRALMYHKYKCVPRDIRWTPEQLGYTGD